MSAALTLGEKYMDFSSLFLRGLIALLQECPFIMSSSIFHPEIKHSLGRKIRQIYLVGLMRKIGIERVWP